MLAGMGKYPEWVIPKCSVLPRGSRLTEERLQALKIGNSLIPQELDVLIEVLYNREASLAWDFTECGKLEDFVEPDKIDGIEERR